jgi:hypothetical protein
MNDIKQYNLNVGAIELNQKIDSEVSMVKTNLAVCEYAKDDTLYHREFRMSLGPQVKYRD